MMKKPNAAIRDANAALEVVLSFLNVLTTVIFSQGNFVDEVHPLQTGQYA